MARTGDCALIQLLGRRSATKDLADHLEKRLDRVQAAGLSVNQLGNRMWTTFSVAASRAYYLASHA